MKNTKLTIGGLLLVLLAFLLAIFFYNSPNINQDDVHTNPDLKLLAGTTINVDGGLVTIDGKIENTVDYTYEDIEVSFNLIDSNGESIGTASAVIDHLYGTNIWVFQAFTFFPFDMDIQEFTLESLEGIRTTEIVEDPLYEEGATASDGAQV